MTQVPPQPVEVRFVNKLVVDGPRYREELSLERWKGDRLQDRRRFVAACDGQRRISFAEPLPSASGTPKAQLDQPAPRPLGLLPLDPLWLTDTAPLLSAARNEECLGVALANPDWSTAPVSTSAREIALLEPRGNARRWTAWIDAGQRLPRRLEGAAGTTVAATFDTAAVAGWTPLKTAKREAPALGAKLAATRALVETTVVAFAAAEQFANAEFATVPPAGMELEDRTNGPPRLVGKKGG